MEAKPLEMVSRCGFTFTRGEGVEGERMQAGVGALKKGHLHLGVGNARGAFFLPEALVGTSGQTYLL